MTTAATCPSPISGSNHSNVAVYNTSNRITSNSASTFVYDDAGNITNDGINKYAYDLDGRICAVTTAAAGGAISQYVYDAEGRRVAKGSLTTFPTAHDLFCPHFGQHLHRDCPVPARRARRPGHRTQRDRRLAAHQRLCRRRPHCHLRHRHPCHAQLQFLRLARLKASAIEFQRHYPELLGVRSLRRLPESSGHRRRRHRAPLHRQRTRQRNGE